MKSFNYFFYSLIIFIFLQINGCSTPYGPAGALGGYSDLRLDRNVYKINFGGNGFTSSEQTQTFVLRRAAELTIQNGYKYFVLLDANTNNNVTFNVTPGQINTNTTGNYQSNIFGSNGMYHVSGYGNQNSTTTYNPPTVQRVDRYITSAIVKMYKNKVKNSFNAEIILSNFTKK